MSLPAHKLAVDASFQAFVNCYLREVCAGTWHLAAAWQASSGVVLAGGETHVVELELGAQFRTLALGVSFRSLVGRHTLTATYERQHFSRTWRRLDALSTQLTLIDAVYAQQPESPRRLELIGRVVESHQVMTAYLQHWLTTNSGVDKAPERLATFIDSEQSVIFGHWLHPTPKSRQGIHNWQHAHYAPELGGRFQLHFFAATRKLVAQHSLLDVSAEELSRQIASQGPSAEKYQQLASALGENYCLLPLHPLQAQWLLHQDYVLKLLTQRQLIELGPLGPAFTPTSSVRSLYCESSDFMLKVSMPVKITNSLRINLKSELGDSVWVSKLLRLCGMATKFPELRPIEDPAYITLSLPDREETGFEVIFRSNPFPGIDPSNTPSPVHSIAALVQDPLPGQAQSQLAALVRAAAAHERLPLEQASLCWFDAYWHCAIASALGVYEQYGIGLEAHQQNTLLDFTDSGYPKCCYYRDIQGLALTEGARKQLLRLVPELAQLPKIFEEDDIVRNGFGYYVFFNQLYSVINRFALDGLLEEAVLLGVVRQKLVELRRTMRSFGAAFIDTMLDQPTIPCKANLLTRIADMDELQSENELAVYTMIKNPLQALHAAAKTNSTFAAPAHFSPHSVHTAGD